MVVAIGNIQIALRIDVTPMRPVEPGLSRRATIAVASTVPSGNGCDHAGHHIDTADGMILGVHH